MTGGTRVSAVVLAYGAEPQLADCVHALLASSGARRGRGPRRQRLHQ